MKNYDSSEIQIDVEVTFTSNHLSLQVRKRLLEFKLSAFQRSPGFIAILKVCMYLQGLWFLNHLRCLCVLNLFFLMLFFMEKV